MARQPRLCVPGQLHHLLLRGHGRQPVCVDDADRQALQQVLLALAPEFGVAVHAWALMADHVHLLVTPRKGGDCTDGAPLPAPPAGVLPPPPPGPGNLSGWVQALGRRYVPTFNRRHGHRGSLWEGRFRSTVLEADVWALPAMVWLDTHPWRSGWVAEPTQPHPCTTAGHYLGVQPLQGLAVLPQFWALGNTPFAREAAYRTLLEQGLSAASRAALADAALRGWALGSAAFVAGLQNRTPRRLLRGRPGRPPGGQAPSRRT
jgi:putative transposase